MSDKSDKSLDQLIGQITALVLELKQRAEAAERQLAVMRSGEDLSKARLANAVTLCETYKGLKWSPLAAPVIVDDRPIRGTVE